jgi:hypothetical protein
MDAEFHKRILWSIRYHDYWSQAAAHKARDFRETGCLRDARAYQDLSASHKRLAIQCRLKILEG